MVITSVDVKLFLETFVRIANALEKMDKRESEQQIAERLQKVAQCQ